MVGVPAFAWWCSGPTSRMCWPILSAGQGSDHPGAQEQAQQHGRGAAMASPEGHVPEDREARNGFSEWMEKPWDHSAPAKKSFKGSKQGFLHCRRGRSATAARSTAPRVRPPESASLHQDTGSRWNCGEPCRIVTQGLESRKGHGPADRNLPHSLPQNRRRPRAGKSPAPSAQRQSPGGPSVPPIPAPAWHPSTATASPPDSCFRARAQARMESGLAL